MPGQMEALADATRDKVEPQDMMKAKMEKMDQMDAKKMDRL